MEIVKVEFNYQTLDAESRIVVQQRTSEIHSLVRRSAQDIFDIGQKLAEVRSKLADNKQGGFEGWLKAEFEWSYRTALNFIRVYEQFNNENFSLLDIAPSALYLLAAPSTEPETRQQFIEQAKTEPVTHKQVKQAVKEYGYSKAQQTKLPPKIKSAFTASPPALDDFNQAGYDDDFNRAGGAGNGNIPAQFGGMITTLEAAGWFVVSPDLKYGLPRLLAAIEPAGYFVASPDQLNAPNCPCCARKF